MEDDQDHRDLILRAFRDDREKFRISIAGSIAQAREITGHDPPDLIISDWNLPDGKGIDILSRVNDAVTIPLIVMTGYGDERLAVEIMKSGAVDYIVKSATVFEDLPNISRKALRFWENLQERMRAETAVRDSQKRLADILAFLPDPVLAIDKNGTVIAWNNAMEGLTGVAAADMLGKGDHEYSLPFYGIQRPILVDLIFKDDQDVREDYVYVNRDGQKIIAEVFSPMLNGGRGAHLWGTASPLVDAAGNLSGAIEVIRDITDRKNAELALQENEIKFRTLLESVPDLILVHRGGIILYVNQVAQNITGYTLHEILNQPISRFIATEYQDPVSSAIRKRSLGEPVAPYEIEILTKSGGRLTVMIRGCGIEFDGAPASLNVLTDITDRKRADEALRESEIRFRALIQNSSDIIRILDKDGRIVYESPSAERILGYPAGYLIGRNPMDDIHPDDLEHVNHDLREVFDKTNPGIPTEFRIRKADGDYIWVDALAANLLDEPGINGIVVTTRPIQQRKEAEAALQESEERLRLALEGAGAAFWEWYLPTGKAVFSDRFYTMLGYTPGEFPATFERWAALMHPDERSHILADLDEQIKRKRPLCEIEFRMRTKEGGWMWVLGRGKIVEFDSQGVPVRLTGVNLDITNRRLMESEIRSLNAVLEQRIADRTEALSKANQALEEENAQRLTVEDKLRSSLDEKTLLLKEIHHRVKNNLQIIASLLNLQSRYIRDEPTLAALRESQNRVRAMALVHEKLYRSEDLAHIDLNEYITFLGTGLFQFYGAKGRGIRFRLDMHDVDVDINTAIPLGLIINELISNSLKYAFPGGREGEVSISIKKEEHILTVNFHDDGIGIPDSLDWKNTHSLGLQLVNTLTDQMDGTIELDRTAGTTFILVLHEKQ
nr:response regulator [Methanoregula sp.]